MQIDSKAATMSEDEKSSGRTEGEAPGLIAAYRILLVEKAAAGQQVLMELAVPRPMLAVKETVTAQLLNEPPSAQELTRVYLLDVGVDLGPEGFWQKIVAPAVQGVPALDPAKRDLQEPAADLQVRSDRVLWQSDRSLLICNHEREADILVGIAYFTFFVKEVARLEREIASSWAQVRKDMRYIHQVDDQSFAEQPRVNERSRWSYELRADYARIEPFIDSVPNYVPANARRIIQELSTHTEILNRLKYLDQQIEVFEDTYELANDRILEYSYYRGEYKLEVIIIIVLIIELIFMAMDYLQP